MLQLGYREIGLITGPLAEDCSQDRSLGYETALLAAGITPEPAWIIEGDWSARSGYDALMTFSRIGDIPGAIFAQNDLMAAGVLRAAHDLGLNVPEQLAVIGVDDIPMAAYLEPPLTTIRQDFCKSAVKPSGYSSTAWKNQPRRANTCVYPPS